MIALIAVGAVLVVAIVVIAFLLGQNSGKGSINSSDQTPLPGTSETPATPVASPSVEPTDSSGSNGGTDNTLHFTSFHANPNVACDPDAEEKAQPQISWSAANATAVYWTPNNEPATADNGYKVPSSGNQDDMSASKGAGERYEFPCAHRNTFDTTITIYGANGQSVSKHVLFTDTNSAAGDGGN